jgi:hypothetical protein
LAKEFLSGDRRIVEWVEFVKKARDDVSASIGPEYLGSNTAREAADIAVDQLLAQFQVASHLCVYV